MDTRPHANCADCNKAIYAGDDGEVVDGTHRCIPCADARPARDPFNVPDAFFKSEDGLK